MNIEPASSPQEWDAFLLKSRFRPFLQSWTMGEVFLDIGQEPVRLIAREGSEIVGICQAILVPARRGKHLAVHYGPVLSTSNQQPVTSNPLPHLLTALRDAAVEHHCSFIRISPFVPLEEEAGWREAAGVRTVSSPLHLLGEHIWYLPLVQPDQWSNQQPALRLRSGQATSNQQRTENNVLMSMRKTTRNLIRRAEKEGVTVRASSDPARDIDIFLRLHDETKDRHGFTPYHEEFFRAQVKHFAPRNECTLYLAEYQGQVLASSIHMHVGGVTSYHHGASSHFYSKIPASYLLQWTAIKDALRRGDSVYSFWGVAPLRYEKNPALQTTDYRFGPSRRRALDAEASSQPSGRLQTHRHPFAGVTLFKMGFGGTLLNLMHCVDVPLNRRYHLTRAFEVVRKWKRGF